MAKIKSLTGDTTIDELLAAVETETTGTDSMLALHTREKAMLDDALSKAGITPEQQKVVNDHYAKLMANDEAVAAAIVINTPPPPPQGGDDQPFYEKVGSANGGAARLGNSAPPCFSKWKL